MTQFE